METTIDSVDSVVLIKQREVYFNRRYWLRRLNDSEDGMPKDVKYWFRQFTKPTEHIPRDFTRFVLRRIQ